MKRGLAASRNEAQGLIEANSVLVNGAVGDKASRQVRKGDVLKLLRPLKYVSRGGRKLEAALAHFAVDVSGKSCLDIGASTGGFTDCLLQHGAADVRAVDVGHDLLHEKLKRDRRVAVFDGVNIRLATTEDVGGTAELVVVDVSFISLCTIMAVLAELLEGNGDLIALVKPQFEATHREVSKGKGVIKQEAIHRRVLEEVSESARACGLEVVEVIAAPAPKGNANQEFLMHARKKLI